MVLRGKTVVQQYGVKTLNSNRNALLLLLLLLVVVVVVVAAVLFTLGIIPREFKKYKFAT